MASSMVVAIVGAAISAVVLLIFFVVLFSFKPWRLFSLSRSRTTKVGELERPLVGDSANARASRTSESSRDYDLEGAHPQNDGSSQNTISQAHVFKDSCDEGSCLSLEVISGPSQGVRCFVQSKNSSNLPFKVGRVPPCDLLLSDSEVSGKHAMINWNLNNLRWELRDMGSLNGTLLNAQQISRSEADNFKRVWGEPFQIASGDVICFGTTSKAVVHIGQGDECQSRFGIGVASDPMALRRGGKKFPMEDVCYYQCPLHGVDQFGLFSICDGHGGAEVAKSASRLLFKMMATSLSDSSERERIFSSCDASDVLRGTFFRTEAALDHDYEGCTATLLLVWSDGETIFAQCANVGDSACVINVGTMQIEMTEDHRFTSDTERRRLEEMGQPLKMEETRLCGLNLARMLGDKFPKEQDARFSSLPYISKVVRINRASNAFAVMASDGLWDVMKVKEAIKLVIQVRDKYSSENDEVKENENSAAKIANYLLNEARTLRTEDNTSVIYLDFDTLAITACKAKS